MNRKTRILHLGMLFIPVLAILIAAFAPFMAPKASAVTYTYNTATVDVRAYSYAAYTFITQTGGTGCFDYLGSTITADDAVNLSWFSLNGGNSVGGTFLANPPGGAANSAGQVACDNEDNWLSTALGYWGYGSDYGQFLQDIGYTHQSDGSYENVNDNSVTRDKIKNVIQGKFYHSSTVTLAADEKYYTLFVDFTAGCQATSLGSWASLTANQKNTDTDKLYEVQVIDPSTGDIVDTGFRGQLGKGDNIDIGEGVLSNAFPTCQELVAQLNNATLVAAYSTYVKAQVAAGNAPTSDGGAGGAGVPSPEAKCDATITNPLTWIICPLVSGAIDAINKLDDQINCLLQVDLTDVFGAGTNQGNPYAPLCGTSSTTTADATSSAYYQAWNSFRILALAMIVIAGLVMVISQAAGFEILDAYTIRKVLPRLLIAGIAITLSWQLMELLVALTNAAGFAVRQIIYAPFTAFTGAQFNQLGTTFASGLIGLGALLIYGPLGIASFALTALLGVMIAFVTLILRKLVIIFLLMMAPFAIACYILPNTQRFWKIWWETLSKSLLMFPIIAAFIAIGRVFSAVVWNGGHTSTINTIIAFIAYFAPYFMIPFAFRLAGGAVATIGGLVNDRSRGAFDGLRNFRGRQAKQRRENAIERARTGNTFKRAGNNPDSLRNQLNAGIAGASQIGSAGFNPRQMRANMRTAMRDTSEDRVSKFAESKEFQAFQGDDAKLWAAKYTGHDRIAEELEKKDAGRFAGAKNRIDREDAVSQIMRAQKLTNNATFQRARIRSQSKTGTGYQYKDAKGQTQVNTAQMIDDINDAYGSDRNGAGRALAEMRGSLAQSGHVAGLAGYGAWAEQMEARYRDPATNTSQAVHEAIMDDTINSVSPGQAIYGKPASAAAIGAAHARRIQRLATGVAAGTNTVDELSAAVAGAAGVYDAMTQASPQNASALANEMMDADIAPIVIRELDANGDPVPGGAQLVATHIHDLITSQMGGNEEFVHRRRDFSQSALKDAANMSPAQRAALAQQQQGNLPNAGGQMPGQGTGGMPGMPGQ